MTHDGWEPVLKFVEEGREFALGFEAGRIWTLLRSGEEVKGAMVHVDNALMFLRMADSLGLAVRSQDINDESSPWILITFSEAA